jgi:hypothetical protein
LFVNKLLRLFHNYKSKHYRDSENNAAQIKSYLEIPRSGNFCLFIHTSIDVIYFFIEEYLKFVEKFKNCYIIICLYLRASLNLLFVIQKTQLNMKTLFKSVLATILFFVILMLTALAANAQTNGGKEATPQPIPVGEKPVFSEQKGSVSATDKSVSDRKNKSANTSNNTARASKPKATAVRKTKDIKNEK